MGTVVAMVIVSWHMGQEVFVEECLGASYCTSVRSSHSLQSSFASVQRLAKEGQ